VRDRHVKFHEDRDNLLVVGGVNAYSVERSVSALARLVLDHGLGNVTAQCFLGTIPRRSSTPNCLRRSVVGAGITSADTHRSVAPGIRCFALVLSPKVKRI
jgi:hypothetical protein